MRYFFLALAVWGAFAGGVWLGHVPEARACEIDLRYDASAALARLSNHPTFKTLADGTRATEQPCRVRLAHDDGATLDHVFKWAALTNGRAAGSLLLKTDELQTREAYEQALEFLIDLNFSNEAVDRLEDWRRRARIGMGRTLELAKVSHRPGLMLAIVASPRHDRAWRIILEITP